MGCSGDLSPPSHNEKQVGDVVKFGKTTLAAVWRMDGRGRESLTGDPLGMMAVSATNSQGNFIGHCRYPRILQGILGRGPSLSLKYSYTTPPAPSQLFSSAFPSFAFVLIFIAIIYFSLLLCIHLSFTSLLPSPPACQLHRRGNLVSYCPCYGPAPAPFKVMGAQ